MKKTLHPEEQKRLLWAEEQKQWDSEQIIFLDESRLNLGMTRLYGRSKIGERINDYVPTLKEGAVVVMDNLSVHKVKGVIEPILACGATIKYLPPDLPDFNPIELMWSKVKAI